jgi:hypothetical protein
VKEREREGERERVREREREKEREREREREGDRKRERYYFYCCYLLRYSVTGRVSLQHRASQDALQITPIHVVVALDVPHSAIISRMSQRWVHLSSGTAETTR